MWIFSALLAAVRIHARHRGEPPAMFAWLKARRQRREHRTLQDLHLRLLGEARDLQRNGDIRGFAQKTAEAEAVSLQLDEFEATQAGSVGSSGPHPSSPS